MIYMKTFPLFLHVSSHKQELGLTLKDTHKHFLTVSLLFVTVRMLMLC